MSKSKTEPKTYLFHEITNIFPLMEGEDFDYLVKDMRKYGQLRKGILYEGKILDGRNRYRACQILNISFKFEEYSEKMSPIDYIISVNVRRCSRGYLNVAQRAEIGLLLLKEEEKKAKKRILKNHKGMVKKDE